MAKSMRSKHKRNMRAIKRVRYEAKELARLKEMVSKTQERELGEALQDAIKDSKNEMETDESPMAGVKLLTPKQMKKMIKNTRKKAKKESEATENQDESMESDDEEQAETNRNSKTLLDDKGRLPEWLTGRQKKKHVRKLRRLKKHTAKKVKSR